MENQTKYCTHCGAENELSSKFCSVCGNALDTQTQQSHNCEYGNPYNQSNYNNTYNPPGYGAPYNQSSNGNPYTPIFNYEGDIFDVPANEVAAFVGPKAAPKYMLDFYKKAATGSKAGFNIVVFLLGFFFGPFVMSFWFFHKKMNKIGAIILAISIALSACSMYASMVFTDTFKNAIVYEFNNEFSQTYNPYARSTNTYSKSVPFDYDDFDDYEYDYNPYYDYDSDYSFDFSELEKLGFTPEKLALVFSIFAISSVGYLALLIICSIFANAWYLKFALGKIHNLKQQKPDASLMDISLAGGTSATLWVCLLIVLIVGSFALSITSFFKFFYDIGSSIY